MSKNRIVQNATHLYIVTGIKIIVPVMIMPYLSRVLSVDQYATYSYMRAVSSFVTLIMDYGFIFSGTKKIANAGNNKDNINKIISSITQAKIMLFCVTFLGCVVLLAWNHLTRTYFAFSMMTVIATALLNLLPDYVFRGLEKMGALSCRMIVSKSVTTLFLFLLVRSESDFLMVAVLELANAAISILFTLLWLYKRQYKIYFSKNLRDGITELKEGLDYFIYVSAPSLYGALNTIVVGNVLTEYEVVYWSTSWSVVSAFMNMYVPISNSIFPVMIKEKDYSIIKKTLKIFCPIIVVGSLCLALCSRFIFLILVGEQYVVGALSLVLLLPVLLFSFISIIYGAPVLGAMGKERELRNTSVITAVFHLLGLLILYIMGCMTLVSICVLRVLSEIICASLRIINAKKRNQET